MFTSERTELAARSKNVSRSNRKQRRGVRGRIRWLATGPVIDLPIL